jgi:hypothetical protein
MKFETIAWMASMVCLATAASACATTTRAEPVSVTTITSASAVPDASVEVQLAREPRGRACGTDLRSNVGFRAGTADIVAGEDVEIERWAACLTQPYLATATVVLAGSQDLDTPAELFVRRASRVRDALVQRGVDARRIVIGTPSGSLGHGPYAVSEGVHLQATNQETIRGFTQPR